MAYDWLQNSSQISKRSDENWGSLLDLKKKVDRQTGSRTTDGSASDKFADYVSSEATKLPKKPREVGSVTEQKEF